MPTAARDGGRIFVAAARRSAGLPRQEREESGLRQVDLAKKLKRRQDYVSDIETGQKVVTVVELMEWAAALGFDPHEALRVLKGK